MYIKAITPNSYEYVQRNRIQRAIKNKVPTLLPGQVLSFIHRAWLFAGEGIPGGTAL